MTLGDPIASGNMADIYSWDAGHVLKLFKDWVGADLVDREARATAAVHASGFPVPAVGERLDVDGRMDTHPRRRTFRRADR